MKRYLYTITLALLAIAETTYAQTQGISYQAVILNPDQQELPGVDAQSGILPNKDVSLRFSIINKDRTNDYQEIHSAKTDAFGMINLFIGDGNPTSSNSFEEINWDGTAKELLVEIDFSAGNNFTFLSNQKLTYIPYGAYKDLSTTGTLTVAGPATFKNDISIKGKTTFDTDTKINGDLSIDGMVNVTGNTALQNKLTVAGETQVDNNISISGVTNIDDSLNVKGISNLSNLVVKGDGSINGEHVALFENTGGGRADGIAIRINKETLSFRNRFVTFYGKDNYVAGRIESFDLAGGDTFESFPVPDFANLFDVFDFDNVLTGGSLPSMTFSSGSLPRASFRRGRLPSINFKKFRFSKGSLPSLSFNPGSLPTANFDTGSFPTLNFDGFFDPTAGATASDEIGRVVGWGMRNGYPGYIPTSHWQIAAVPLVLAAKQLAMNQGVIYGSKGADYAEWLEKENPEDKFVFGEVVGVKGGKISKTTEGADQVLTISLAPIVLGNMPDENRKDAFEKVGFMGQVPVLVLGDVKIGDYILASGYNDGYAKALSPENIQLHDLKNIIGKAWSSSDGNKVSLINVSVGLKTNEWVDIFDQQEKRLNALESKLRELEAISNRLGKLEAAVQQMGVN